MCPASSETFLTSFSSRPFTPCWISSEAPASRLTITGNPDAMASETTIPNASTNPHIGFYNNRRGYVRTRITPTQITADFRAVAAVSEHGAAATTVRSFVIHDGQRGLADA